MENDLVCWIRPSRPRRAFALAILVALGALLIYIALSRPAESLIWQVFLLVLGIGSVVVANKMYRDSGVALVLEDGVLREDGGRVLTTLDDVEAVERGFAAFKPSNGLIIRTRTPGDRAWAPGIWWRVGRRIGIGGVTTAADAKAMAEIMQGLIAQRQS